MNQSFFGGALKIVVCTCLVPLYWRQCNRQLHPMALRLQLWLKKWRQWSPFQIVRENKILPLSTQYQISNFTDSPVIYNVHHNFVPQDLFPVSSGPHRLPRSHRTWAACPDKTWILPILGNKSSLARNSISVGSRKPPCWLFTVKVNDSLQGSIDDRLEAEKIFHQLCAWPEWGHSAKTCS